MNKIYSRLAFTNIKNNKTLYMPYIISGMVMIAMFYVMMFLNTKNEILNSTTTFGGGIYSRTVKVYSFI